MRHLIQKFKKIIFSDRCSMCKNSLKSNERYICDICLEYLESSKALKNIGNYYYLYYYNEKMRELISDYKLKNRRGIGEQIARLISNDLQNFIKSNGIEIVIPVPINSERLRERGFNQIEEILDYCKIKYIKVERVKDTKHMYKLITQEERDKNIENAFKISSSLSGKKILIVDDILTTGSTVKELIKELRATCGVQDIMVFVVAVSQSFLKRGEKWD